MSSVLVPIGTDGAGRDALPFAELLAGLTDGRLRLLTAVAPGADVEAARDALASIADTCAGAAECVVVEYADAGLAVRDAVESAPGAVVCMTTLASRSLTALTLGSTAQSVLEQLDSPVVLLGPHAITPASVGRVVVAVDPCSATSIRAIDAAAELAAAAGARLELVEVVPTGGAADLEVERLRASEHGVDVDCRVIESGAVASALLRHAEDVGASVIAMTTHARRPLARLALGSVAIDVVRRSTCPVLVVRRHGRRH